MDIQSLNLNNNINAPQYGVGAMPQPAPREAPEEQLNIQEVFTSSKDAPVNVIIQGGDAKALEALKKELSANADNQVTADLPIISGFSMSISPEDTSAAALLAQAQQDGMMVSLDAVTDFTSDNTVTQDLNELHSYIANHSRDENIMFGVEKLHEQGITGKGTTICVLDSGIAPHPDLKDRIIAFKDCVDGKTEPYDDNGHGTHCAGICAGDGKSSGGKNVGVAPEANIVGVKVLDQFGYGSTSQILRGIQWAITHKHKYGINVISMSLGHEISTTRFLDPLTLGVQAAAKCGITVVVSAGNDGPDEGTLSAPGNAPSAITVGALNDQGTPQTDDDWIAYFSSCGPSKYDHIEKPDVIAPGVDIISCSNKDDGYVKMSGTSMATPFTAGLACLMKQANPHARSKEIKAVIMNTADPIDQLRKTAQGAGVVDPQEAVANIQKK